MSTPLLEIRCLKKSWQPPASAVLQEIDLVLPSQETLAITGKSGAGKTTLLQIIGSLESFDEGEIFFQGVPFRSLDVTLFRNQHIGFIFQSAHLLEGYTVIDNVLFPGWIARKPHGELLPRAHELLAAVGMQDRYDQIASTLSGGEKQRVAIARALMNDPPLLLADEPTGNLDAYHSEIVHQILIDQVRSRGKSLIVVTHDASLANRCDRELRLHQGKLWNPSEV